MFEKYAKFENKRSPFFFYPLSIEDGSNYNQTIFMYLCENLFTNLKSKKYKTEVNQNNIINDDADYYWPEYKIVKDNNYVIIPIHF